MSIKTRTAMALAGLALLSISALPAFGQVFNGPSGPDHDPVTGYVCDMPGCGTVRMNEASCICRKQNPYETNVKKLQLICETKEQGQWVACPVKPRYGVMIN